MNTALALPINTSWSDAASYPIRIARPITPEGQLVDRRVQQAFQLDQQYRAQMRSEYLDYLEDDWDGEGASAISYDALVNANSFLAQAIASGRVPEISPEADGFIQLEWYTRPDCVFSVSFGPSNVIAYSGIFGEDSGVYGTEDISRGVPEAIWVHVRRVVEAAPS